MTKPLNIKQGRIWKSYRFRCAYCGATSTTSLWLLKFRLIFTDTIHFHCPVCHHQSTFKQHFHLDRDSTDHSERQFNKEKLWDDRYGWWWLVLLWLVHCIILVVCSCILHLRHLGCDFMNQPSHYVANGISPVDCFKQGLVSKEEYIGFCKCNIIKYLCRAEYKENAKEDYEKAQHYIQLLLEIVE